ncbi:anti-sigma factor [Paenibacillus barengoltzii]|jgi:hypothetical protein|uniref:Anti-sigma K factor RskA C-terminal domain-containing protein n=1 Tax=Paenibacillus barengoltzii G22 TaxID=1235795 RepID=R9LAT2_9BACL|nr:anti-sigma factor [Paenibacillus barengoltzii]EOS55491.1 hypothetical protein C812_02618 [Paenibacillus barengoltzii G22]
MNGQNSDKVGNIGGPGNEKVCIRMYTEQEWIDWLLGTLEEPRHSEMAMHLNHCKICLEQKTYWESVLGLANEDGSMPELKQPEHSGTTVMAEQLKLQDMSELVSGSAPGNRALPPYPAADPEQSQSQRYQQIVPPSVPRLDLWADLAPSVRIRRSLRNRVRWIGWRRRALRLFTVRWKWTVSLAAMLLVLVGMGVVIDHLNQPAASWDRYVQTYEPEALPVLSKPDTISYPIAMGRMEPENGMVWYNAGTREMLMLVGGLVPDKGQMVRVWIVKEGARDSLGLLQYHNNRAHLYVKDKTLGYGDSLELTIEPAYGTPEMNGSTNSISLDLLGR